MLRFVFKICKKTWVLYIFRTPSLRPCWTPKGTSKIPKRAPRCMRTLRQKTKRAPRCMGTLFEHSRSRMVAQDGFPQIAQSICFKLFGTLFRPNGKTSLKDMERTATGHRKTKRQSETTKTVAPQVLENVDYLSNA